MRYNPFRPGGLISPGIFHGRVSELKHIEHGLFQAKHGNPVHFMIQGERGIGKSSLFYVVELIARGSLPTFYNDSLNFLVISVDLGGAESQLDIIRALGRQLRSELNERTHLKEKAKAFWEWASNWEILGVRYHKEKGSFDPQDAVDEFVSRLSSLCQQLEKEIDGVLILIDEADRPGPESGLGEICKNITERLTRKSCNNVVLGLAGLPGLTEKLRGSHESSPRIFNTMLLDTLSEEEIELVIDSGLKDANKNNKKETKIKEDAIVLLCKLSEGYPHFIQQFAYSAFEQDSDCIIDFDDVFYGAFSENGALYQLGDKYFSNMYHLRIASNDYRYVLNTMADHGDNWVSRKKIIEESGLSKTTVTNALSALKAREIIVADETRKRRGFYRLPTRSFAAWIQAFKRIPEDADQSVSPGRDVPVRR